MRRMKWPHPLILVLRSILIVVALITMSVGVSAYSTSHWRYWQGPPNSDEKEEWREYLGNHQFCDKRHRTGSDRLEDLHWKVAVSKGEHDEKVTYPPRRCPEIEMELAFVGISIVCFMWSILCFFLVIYMNMAKDYMCLQILDCFLTMALGIMLIFSAAEFIGSAVESEYVVDYSYHLINELHTKEQSRKGDGIELRKEAKIAAGAFGIIQGMFQVVLPKICSKIAKASKEKTNDFLPSQPEPDESLQEQGPQENMDINAN